MKRFLLAAVASLSLVTAAVTAEGWHISAIVNGDHAAFYTFNGVRVVFPNKAVCEGILASEHFKEAVKDEFEEDERNEHGANTTFVWGCVLYVAPLVGEPA